MTMKKILPLFFLIIFSFTACQHRFQIKNASESLKERVRAPVYFEFGQWVLSPEEESRLSEKAGLLRAHPDEIVILEGHTDSIGSEENNIELGDRRASYVRWRLSLEGVDPRNLIVTSVGEAQIENPSLQESLRKKERRVDFRVK